MADTLGEIRLVRLRKHYLALSELLLRQLSDKGAVIARSDDDRSFEDPVATHHLVEWTLSCGDDSLAGIRHRALQWMVANNSLPHDPFTLDSLLASGVKDKQLEAIAQSLSDAQLPSGLLSFYTAYLHGGDHFSTLWGIKILQYWSPQYDAVIETAAHRCAEDIDVFLRSPSHAGYLLLLLSNIGLEIESLPATVARLSAFLLESQDVQSGLWKNDPLETAFVAYDLLACGSSSAPHLEAAARALSGLYALDHDADKIPPRILEYRERASDSAFLQMLLRALIAGNYYFRSQGIREPSRDLRDNLVGVAPSLMSAVEHLVDRTKKLQLELDRATKIPSTYRVEIDRFLSDSPYEKNVLIMMTFAFNDPDVGEHYSETLNVIRKALAARGLNGFITTDKRYHPTLFGNLQVYLAGCKAGIAVFDNFIPHKANNPNVAMEAGWLMAQGKPLAILKDKSLEKLPSDWAGHLYIQFVQANPAGLEQPLLSWLSDNQLGADC